MKRLGDERVRRAAEPFVRVLVRVPEAYPLLGPFATTRPGLLVLDAHGRRVDSIDLKRVTDPAAIAQRLRKARTAPATERLLVRAADVEAARTLAGRLPGATVTGRLVGARVAAGSLDVAALGKGATVLAPVPVTGADVPAGAWYREGAAHYLPPLLLAPDLGGDTVARRYDLPGVGTGPSAARVPFAAKKTAGVLAVVPDFFGATRSPSSVAGTRSTGPPSRAPSGRRARP